jgi:hypothetical protein
VMIGGAFNGGGDGGSAGGGASSGGRLFGGGKLPSILAANYCVPGGGAR